MQAEVISISGLLLMLMLGLRHGLDPDHIACIDGLTWHAMQHGRRHVPWAEHCLRSGTGSLTLIAVFQPGGPRLRHTRGCRAVRPLGPHRVAAAGRVAVNLRQLLAGGAQYNAASFKFRMISAWLSNHAAPWSIVLTGALFAAVFDTATQASAWGYVAGEENGHAFAAAVAGLGLQPAPRHGRDRHDRWTFALACRPQHQPAAGRAEVPRILGWLVVAISCGVAAYNIGTALAPRIEFDDLAFSAAGFALVALIAVVPLMPELSQRRLRRDCGLDSRRASI